MKKVKVYANNENELKKYLRLNYGEDKEYIVLEKGEDKSFFKRRKYYILEIKEEKKEEKEVEIIVP
ncbi:MAG: hypothetical protein NZ891_02930, partial [bacterium]|nr:hypothetical protein [bacterium]MDW8163678.1 hypothetical protein [Candidatus Omnitrophota bacterium]